MERRDFLKQAAITAAAMASAQSMRASDAEPSTPSKPIARRPLGKTGEHLSIIGFGGIVVMNEDPQAAVNIVSEAVDRGTQLSRRCAELRRRATAAGSGAQALPQTSAFWPAKPTAV